jgi:hypothetical protein
MLLVQSDTSVGSSAGRGLRQERTNPMDIQRTDSSTVVVLLAHSCEVHQYAAMHFPRLAEPPGP